MARRSSFGSSRNSSNRSSQSYAQPKPVQGNQPVKIESKPGLMSGMMGTMFQGLAFGAGSEVAHQAVRGMIGGNGNTHQETALQQNSTQSNIAKCQLENDNLVNCLKFHTSDITQCQDYMNLLKSCETRL